MADLKIRVVPNASRTEIVGWLGDELKIRIASPPVDGEANAELIRFLSKTFDLPRDSVQIISGHACKRKIVRVPHDRFVPPKLI